MKTFEIVVKKRESLGKGATRRIRKEDNVPCVMYGGDKLYHFYAHENLFKKMIYTPEVYIIELDIDGKKHKAVVQEIQFHSVTDKIQHIDFVEVFPDKPVIVSIPVELTGSSIGVKNGGKLRLKRRSLKVKGLLEFLPDKLTIDLTTLDIGQVIKVGDLKYNKLELIDPHRSMVVSVISSRLAAKGTMEEAPEEEAEVAASEESE
jgi:large subunit ribosomal protein L25